MTELKNPVIGVAAKPKNPRALELARTLIPWLEARSLQYRLDNEIASELGVGDPALIVPRHALAQQCSPVVVLGGDGTLISVSRHPAVPPAIVMGVNTGTLGFLTEITAEELFPSLEAVLAGKAHLQTRPLLDVFVRSPGKPVSSFYVINDAVITKEALARLFTIELNVDGNYAAEIRGDGLIISTPGGSTAYSLAAGGSIVHPEVKALLVTPICPHSLTTRPLVLPKSSTISMRIGSAAGNGGVFLTIDGQQGRELQDGDEVIVSASDKSVQFVKSDSRSYFDILATKLHWATRNAGDA